MGKLISQLKKPFFVVNEFCNLSVNSGMGFSKCEHEGRVKGLQSFRIASMAIWAAQNSQPRAAKPRGWLLPMSRADFKTV